MIATVYSISSSGNPSAVRYIGATIRYRKRKLEHLRAYRANYTTKYGDWLREVADNQEQLIFTVLHEVEQEDAWIKEVEEIAAHKERGCELVNHAKGGKGGCNHNYGTAAKLSASLKEDYASGRLVISALTRKLSSERITRYNKSDEHRASASICGKIHGPENLKKAWLKNAVTDSVKQQVILLRTTGMMYKDIAIAAGVSEITAKRIVNGKRYCKAPSSVTNTDQQD